LSVAPYSGAAEAPFPQFSADADHDLALGAVHPLGASIPPQDFRLHPQDIELSKENNWSPGPSSSDPCSAVTVSWMGVQPGHLHHTSPSQQSSWPLHMLSHHATVLKLLLYKTTYRQRVHKHTTVGSLRRKTAATRSCTTNLQATTATWGAQVRLSNG
jgi:hypothetical protein